MPPSHTFPFAFCPKKGLSVAFLATSLLSISSNNIRTPDRSPLFATFIFPRIYASLFLYQMFITEFGWAPKYHDGRRQYDICIFIVASIVGGEVLVIHKTTKNFTNSAHHKKNIYPPTAAGLFTSNPC